MSTIDVMSQAFPLSIDTTTPQRLQDLFLLQAQRHADKAFMAHRQKNGSWKVWTWRDVAFDALALADDLKKRGVKKGDSVILRSRNHPLWATAELAILFNESVLIPSYTNFLAKDYRHIQSVTKARFALCDESLSSKPLTDSDLTVIDLGNAIANARKTISETELSIPACASKNSNAEDAACIFFTSGTSGNPRGVVLSHRALIANALSARAAIEGTSLMEIARQRFYSILPLSHSYEHIAGLWLPITLGAEVYYPQTSESLIADMADAAPTLVSAVPRLFETMRTLMFKRLKETSPFRLSLLHRALSHAEHVYNQWRGVSFLARLYYKTEFFLLRKLLNRSARQRFGPNILAFITGGSATHPKIEQMLIALDVLQLQGYGLSEAAPVVSVNLPGSLRYGSVGKALPGTSIRIAKDGEVMVKGPQLMSGYYRDIEATKLALKGGWLYTGDIGHVDKDGFLFLTDRKKDIIVNSGGQNISPQFLETNLELEPEILQACVIGNDGPFLVAVIVANPELKKNQLVQAIKSAVRTANKRVTTYQRVRAYTVAKDPFTHENAMLTPTLKLRRSVIHQTFKKELVALYRDA